MSECFQISKGKYRTKRQLWKSILGWEYNVGTDLIEFVVDIKNWIH